MTERTGDWRQRRQALDVGRSCIVQAPAGSGKTELLTQRLLALLAVANRPEEILAITFTRKAAGEMKQRLLEALTRAATDPPPEAEHERLTWDLARRALATDRSKGWDLTGNPVRLQVMTIDGFCAQLTRRMPWLSRLGDQPAVTERARELYRQAAECLIRQLDDPGLETRAQERLLDHLDNRTSLLCDLLVGMLAKRDQWLRHVLDKRSAAARAMLESGLRSFIETALWQAWQALGEDCCRELLLLGRYAAGNLAAAGDDRLQALAASEELTPTADNLDQWLALAELTLTANGSLRRKVDRRIGFPADKSPQAVDRKHRMQDCLDLLAENDAAAAALQNLRFLPAACFSTGQWEVLEALVELLPAAVIELQEVFRQRGEVDFIEIAGGAHAALGDAARPEDLLLQMDSLIQHILVDEFQDTSYAQYDLLQKLTAGWTPGDGRTLFIVGDPMQSIYRFREAEVGLFLRVWRHGLHHLPMERLALTANFRSEATLVAWFNTFFRDLFPAREDELRGAVRFAAAEAVRDSAAGEAVRFHLFAGRQDAAEAEKVLDLVRRVHAETPRATVAILGRSRLHLEAIVTALRKAGLRYQAQDLDGLADRPVVQDLLALTRALVHPADRIAWLAVLRAPWCGLTLADLQLLASDSGEETFPEALQARSAQADLFACLSADGRRRLERCLPVLTACLQRKGRLPLRRLVEACWLSLGGPACTDAAGLVDAERFLDLLEMLDEGGDLLALESLEERLQELYAAPDPEAGPELQVMTVHKAKGLEFDVVIVPGMGRSVRSQDRDLLRWLEHPDYELLLAPLPPTAQDNADPTYRAIGRILKERDELEDLRLLYVAATRARQSLHLLGHVKVQEQDRQPAAAAGSFLAISWPSVLPILSESGLVGSASAESPSTESAPAGGLVLRRLPAGWSLPMMPASLPGVREDFGRASDFGHYQAALAGTRHTEEGRAIGTLVHFWLQTIAEEGLEAWPVGRLAGLTDWLDAQLYRHGLPRSRHDHCRQAILTSLANALQCPYGRWLLQGHEHGACELDLNGIVDGRLVRSSIDRTFVDRGVRWIVDYKTSGPEPSEAVEIFLQREVTRYCGQLQTYGRLMQTYDRHHPIRTALYFPLIKSWREIEGEG